MPRYFSVVGGSLVSSRNFVGCPLRPRNRGSVNTHSVPLLPQRSARTRSSGRRPGLSPADFVCFVSFRGQRL